MAIKISGTTIIDDSRNLTGAIIDDLKETVFTISDGVSVELNPTNGPIQVWTLGADRTPTTNFDSGASMTLMVDDGTARIINWGSASITWVGGSAPSLATTGYTVLEFWKVSSTIYGALVGEVA